MNLHHEEHLQDQADKAQNTVDAIKAFKEREVKSLENRLKAFSLQIGMDISPALVIATRELVDEALDEVFYPVVSKLARTIENAPDTMIEDETRAYYASR